MTENQRRALELWNEGKSPKEIADDIGVSERSVQRWAKRGNWVRADQPPSERERKVIQMAHRAAERQERIQIDKLEIVETAIWSLSKLLDSDKISVNSPGVGSTASALVRLLEYHSKLRPATAKEWAEEAIRLGLHPSDIAAELRKEWQLRA